MDRREFVTGSVAALSVAVSGCTAVSGSRELSVDPFEPNHVAYGVEELTANKEAAFETIRDDGSEVTYGHHRFTHSGDKGYVELDGAFYRITTEETDERVLIRDFLIAKIDDSEEAEANAVALEDAYGEADRRRIVQVTEPVLRGERDYFDYYVFRGADPDETDLLYEPAYEYVELTPEVPWGRTRVINLQVASSKFVETEYTTTIESVADTVTELARHVDDENLVRRIDDEELTTEQRDAVEAAIDGGTYTERRPLLGDDEPFGGLALAPKRDPETGRPYRIVRYGGEYYTWDVTRTDGRI